MGGRADKSLSQLTAAGKEKVAAEEAAAANPDAPPVEGGDADKKGRGRIVL
jgi:hypothetical protein